MSEKITCIVPQKIYEYICEDAKQRGLSIKAAASRALIAYIEQQEFMKAQPKSITIPISEETYQLYIKLSEPRGDEMDFDKEE